MDPSREHLLGGAAMAPAAVYPPSYNTGGAGMASPYGPPVPNAAPSPAGPPGAQPPPPQFAYDNLPAYALSAIRISTPTTSHVRGAVFTVVALAGAGVLGATLAGRLGLSVGAGFGIFAAAYVAYLIESLLSETFAYVRNLQSGVSAESILNTLRNTAPRILMNCTCYHFEERERVVTESDGRGGTTTRVVFDQVRVNTHTDTAEFRYLSWLDKSGPATGLTAYRITKLRLETFVNWADPATRDRFYWEYQQFQERNRFRDRHMDVSWRMNVDGFEPKILAVTDLDSRPWFLNACGYLLATLAFLSVPYRTWLSQNSVQGDFTLVKEVRSEPTPMAVVVVLPAYFVR